MNATACYLSQFQYGIKQMLVLANLRGVICVSAVVAGWQRTTRHRQEWRNGKGMRHFIGSQPCG